MELEFQELELRYERLRVIRPAREKRLLASLAESGQQVPILVVHKSPPEGYVVIDGYKRVRSLRRLSRDTVRATTLDLEEGEALLVSRQLRTDEVPNVNYTCASATTTLEHRVHCFLGLAPRELGLV
jgi:ParB family chromosome partitioning protein